MQGPPPQEDPWLDAPVCDPDERSCPPAELPRPTEPDAPTVREDELLAACMRDRVAMATTRAEVGLEGRGLSPGGAAIWVAMVSAVDAGRDPRELSTLVQKVTLRGSLELVGGVQRLAMLTSDNAPSVPADRAVDMAKGLGAYARALEVVEAAKEIAAMSPTDVMADPAATAMAWAALGAKATPLAASGSNANEQAQAAFAEKKAEIDGFPCAPTGLAPLDKAFQSKKGVQRRRVYVVGGRPGGGKTSLGIQACTNMARAGHPALFFSREMNEATVANCAANINGRLEGRYLGGDGVTRQDQNRYMDALAAHSRLGDRFIVDDQTRDIAMAVASARAWLVTTVEPVREAARRAQEEAHAAGLTPKDDGWPLGPDDIVPVVGFDYVQKFSLDGKWHSREQQVAAMSTMLSDFALDHGVAVIALAQLNRRSKTDNSPPKISDLRESGALEQDASAIILIDRDTLPPETEGEPVLEHAALIMGKNRYARPCRIPCGWRPRSTRFVADGPIDYHEGSQ